MIRIPRALCHDITLRLVHDISPDETGITPTADIELCHLYNNPENRTVSICPKKNGLPTRDEDHAMRDTGLSPKETLLMRGNIDDIYTLTKGNNLPVSEHPTDSNKKQYNHNKDDVDVTHNNDINQKYHCYEKPNCCFNKVDDEAHPCGRRIPERNKKSGRRPRKLPEIPKHQNKVVQVNTPETQALVVDKSLADELQEALRIPEEDNDVFGEDDRTNSEQISRYQRYLNFNHIATSTNTKSFSSTDNIYKAEDSLRESGDHGGGSVSSRDSPFCQQSRSSDSRSHSSSSSTPDKHSHHGGGSRCTCEALDRACQASSKYLVNINDLEVTHRGMHSFIPRHKDEIEIEIGDALHVNQECEDSWCEGCNLRTKKSGIFPSMYATNLHFLEEDEEDDGCSKFNLRFLGSVEVNYHKGNDVICHAINKVALMTRKHKPSKPPLQCTIEVSQYGIRMMDKSQEGHQNKEKSISNFFALKNISFCGYHPRNQRYFAFITKHPREFRFACHVFLGERSAKRVSEVVGQAFERFYKEYMAFTHPTEDIYME